MTLLNKLFVPIFAFRLLLSLANLLLGMLLRLYPAVVALLTVLAASWLVIGAISYRNILSYLEEFNAYQAHTQELEVQRQKYLKILDLQPTHQQALENLDLLNAELNNSSTPF